MRPADVRPWHLTVACATHRTAFPRARRVHVLDYDRCSPVVVFTVRQPPTAQDTNGFPRLLHLSAEALARCTSGAEVARLVTDAVPTMIQRPVRSPELLVRSALLPRD